MRTIQKGFTLIELMIVVAIIGILGRGCAAGVSGLHDPREGVGAGARCQRVPHFGDGEGADRHRARLIGRGPGPDDFHLLPDSNALNKGNNAQVPADITEDLEGLPRIQQLVVVMCAYESPFRNVYAIPTLGQFGLLLLAAGLGTAALTRLRRRS